MIVIPAIDIKEGQFVRLKKGDFNCMTVYGSDPVSMALEWESQGAEYIHLVDLDGSLGASANQKIIEKIVKALRIPVELGGGIRSTNKLKEYIEMGVERIIIGTAAVKTPERVAGWAKDYRDKLALGVDAIDGWLYVDGWKSKTEVHVEDMVARMQDLGIHTMVYTDIMRDGMLRGPNFSMYEALVKKSDLRVIASGGVSSGEDLFKLKELGLYGAIVGKALYDNKINLKEVLEWIR